jgi:membrane protease YdiL (CAAX protease family)
MLKLVSAALLALVATGLFSGLWFALLTFNLETTPALPWAVLVMAGVLWLSWHYAARHPLLRARRVERGAWVLALVAGGLALIALTGLWIVLFQTGLTRGNALPDFSRYPVQTVAAVIAMAAVLGAVIEEAAFRGFLQSLLERRFSPRVSVALTALALSPGHASTQGFTLPIFGFYLLVDGMLGATAFLCDSILPGIVVHGAGLLAFFALIWPNDASRVVGTAALHDPWLWVHAAQAVGFAGLAIWAFWKLAERRASPSGTG